MVDKINYLGFEISNDGHRPPETCLPKIENTLTPANSKDIHKFLGLINYYRAHIPKLAEIAAPLYNLLNKKIHIHLIK